MTAEVDSQASEIGTAESAMPARIISGSYSACAIVGIALFFLPWLKLSCNNEEMKKQGRGGGNDIPEMKEPMFTQSGYEIVTGKLSENEKFNEEMKEKIGDKLGARGGRKKQNDAQRKEMKDKERGKYPILIIFIVGLAVTAVFGLIHAIAMPSARPMFPFVGAIAACLAIGVTLAMKFPLEKDFGAVPDDPVAAGMQKMFVVERTANYTISVAVTFLAAALVLVHYFLSARRKS